MATIFNDAEKTITPTQGIGALEFVPGQHKYRFSVGNIKMGRVLSWSTLMSDYTVKGLSGVLEDIKGTCGNCAGCVDSCYVRASYRFPGVIHSQAINTWGLRNEPEKVENDLYEQLSKTCLDIVRINQSGELENAEQLAMWCRLADKFPKKHFYLYTKMYGLVTDALNAGNVPANFVILFSVWHEYGVKEYEAVKHLPNVKAFMYDDGVTELSAKVYCPAYNEAGKMDHSHTCESCKLCYKSKAKVIGCHAH